MLKDAEEGEIARAIQAVAQGEAIFSPTIAARLMDYFAAGRALPQVATFPDLTERERENLARIARGHSNAEIADEVLTLPIDAASLAEGQRLVTMRGCTDCHTPDLGGQVLIDDPMLGTFATANLTSGQGSATAAYTVGDWERAIRHGVGPDGRGLVIMPSYEYAGLSDEQVAQMIAHLRTAPPVDRVPAEPVLKPLGRALFLAGQLPLMPAELIDQDVAHVASVPAEASAEYGAYLSTTCTGCHQPNLAGGVVPGSAPGEDVYKRQIMKDAYTLDRDEAALDEYYPSMIQGLSLIHI